MDYGHRHRSRGRHAAGIALLAGALIAATACHRSDATGALDPANELPFGHVDQPVNQAHTTSQTAIGGWAMDDRGVREIRVYVDGHFDVALPLNTGRPDVSKAFPQYARGTNMHGWSAAVAFEAPGAHTILVQAVDTDGATHDIGTLTVVSADK